MPYMFSIGGANANQIYQSFKLANQIVNVAGNNHNALNLLAQFYTKTINKAVDSDNQFASIPLIPPSNNAWTWDDSLRLATRAARSVPNTYITICIPENVSFTFDGVLSKNLYSHERSIRGHSWLDLNGMHEGKAPEEINTILQSLTSVSEIRRDIIFEERNKENQGLYETSVTTMNENQEIDKKFITELNNATDQLVKQINGIENRSFSDELAGLLENEAMSVSQLSVFSNLPEYILRKLLIGEFVIPKKNEAIAIGIGLRLTTRAFNKFLAKCGYSLSDFLINDIIISWCLTNGIKNIDAINKMLLLCAGEIIAGESIEHRNNANILDNINKALVPPVKPTTTTDDNHRYSDIGDDDLIS